MVEHRSVTNFLASMAHEPGLTETDILVAVTSLSFDIAGLEIYLPLTVGARVVLAPWDVTADNVRLAKLIIDCGATAMQATPATWQMLLAAGWQGSGELKILCGGEALAEDLARQLLPRCASLWNMYGPTETTIWSSIQRVSANFTSVTLGRPIANTQLYVLDAHRNPVPIGVVGEIHIGGDGLARGYLNRPELTAELFIDHSFDGMLAQRVYRTGDLARYFADGSIEFIGRENNQTKIRGHRIELGEIETVLTQHPAVRESIVVALKDRPEDSSTVLGTGGQLAAYVVPKESAPSASELRAYLKTKLPDYMLPSTFVILDFLPLTPNGKIDRNALPPLDRDGVSPDQIYVAPGNAREKAIADIWAEILGVKRISVHDNFFDWAVIRLKPCRRFRACAGRSKAKYPCVICSNIRPLPSSRQRSAHGMSTNRKSKGRRFAVTEIEAMSEDEK